MITNRLNPFTLKECVTRDKLALLSRYHCEVVTQNEIDCQKELELMVHMLDIHTLNCDPPVFAFFGFRVKEDGTCGSFYLGGKYVHHGEWDMEDDYITEIANAFQNYLDRNANYGLAVVKDGGIFLAADATFSFREIVFAETTGTGRLFSLQNFPQGLFNGDIHDSLGDDTTIQKIYDRLQSSYFTKTENTAMNTVYSHCSDGSGSATANLPTAGLVLSDPVSPNLNLLGVDARTSEDSSGNALIATSVSGTFTLIYEFYNGGESCITPKFKAEILPGADASLSASWNVYGAASQATAFAADLLPALAGTGAKFTLDLEQQSILPKGSPQVLIVKLALRESSTGTSTYNTEEITVLIPSPVIQIGSDESTLFVAEAPAEVTSAGQQKMDLRINKGYGEAALVEGDGYVRMKFINRSQGTVYADIYARIGCDLGNTSVTTGNPEDLTGNNIILNSGNWLTLDDHIGNFFDGGSTIVDEGEIVFNKIEYSIASNFVDSASIELTVEVEYFDTSGAGSGVAESYFAHQITLDSYVQCNISGSRDNLEAQMIYKADYNTGPVTLGIADFTDSNLSELVYGYQGSEPPETLDGSNNNIIEYDPDLSTAANKYLAHVVSGTGSLIFVDVLMEHNSGLRCYADAGVFNTDGSDYDGIRTDHGVPVAIHERNSVLMGFPITAGRLSGSVVGTPGTNSVGAVSDTHEWGDPVISGTEVRHQGSPTSPRAFSIVGGKASGINGSYLVTNYGIYTVEIVDTRDNGWELNTVSQYKFTKH